MEGPFYSNPLYAITNTNESEKTNTMMRKRIKECEWNEQTSSERRKRIRIEASNTNNENGREGMLVTCP
jgi:hypothetical protein